MLRMYLAHSTTKWVGRPPKSPLWPDPLEAPLSSPHIRDQFALSLRSKQTRELLLALPHCFSGNSNKALPGFPVWHLINFYEEGQEPWLVTVSLLMNPPADARDRAGADSIPGLGRSPGGGNGNPFQYSCLEIPMDRGAWRVTVHGVSKSRIRLSG